MYLLIEICCPVPSMCCPVLYVCIYIYMCIYIYIYIYIHMYLYIVQFRVRYKTCNLQCNISSSGIIICYMYHESRKCSRIFETFLRFNWISLDFPNQSWHLFRGKLKCWCFSNNTSRWVWFKTIPPNNHLLCMQLNWSICYMFVGPLVPRRKRANAAFLSFQGLLHPSRAC